MAAGPYTNAAFQEIVGPVRFEIPDLYGLLAGVVPGFDSIRGVARLGLSVHIVSALLAGMGAAVLLGAFKRRAGVASTVLVAGVALYVLWPVALGTGSTGRADRASPWRTVEVGPNPQQVEFFEELEALGNRGPIVELPLAERGLYRWVESPKRILLSFYHGRRASACFGSYFPDRPELKRAGADFPSPESRKTLRRLGFTTAVIHVGQGADRVGAWGRKLLLLESSSLKAYALTRPENRRGSRTARPGNL